MKDQLTIPTMEHPQRKQRTTLKKICENPDCKKEYDTVQSNSRFCSSSCRHAVWKKNNPGQKQQTVSEEKPIASPLSSIPLAGVSPATQIVINLLEKENARWEKNYNEERNRRKKVEEELTKLKEDAMKKEHANALQGIENAKPDFLDRMLNGISNLPPQIVEQFAPLIGRLGNMLVPPSSGGNQVEGVQGQLDEPQMQFISWINSMPAETQKKFMMAMAELARFDEQKLNTVVTQICQFLKVGSTMQPSYDQSMYGS